MIDLIKIKNREVGVSSREIAINFKKEHRGVLRDIDNLKEKLTDGQALFIESEYTHNQNNQRYREYQLTKGGLRMFIDSKRKTSDLQPVIDLYNSLGGDVETTILTSRFEDSFMAKLEQVLDELDVGIEREYSILNYRLDGYIKDYSLAIEYDEEQHEYQADEDKARERDIEKEIGCQFVRLDYEDTDATNIGKVINAIMEVK